MYVASLMENGSFWRRPLLFALLPVPQLPAGLYRSLASEILRTVEDSLVGSSEPTFFGHRVDTLVRYNKLLHTGEGLPLDVCENIAEAMLSDPRVNLKWLPDAIERRVITTLCRLCVTSQFTSARRGRRGHRRC